MAEWRFGRGWSEQALERRLAEARDRPRNFDPSSEMSPATGWRRHASETLIARERTGPPEPGGDFERAWEAVTRYEFSDPHTVRGHFEPDVPLEGRAMLLELKVLGLRFLTAVRVGAVRHEREETQTVRGYRYDTLHGHIESGWEWFLLTKSHATGEIRFRIQADWRPGDFPNWWSHVGFRILGRHYQRRWSRRAHQRLRRIVEERRPVPEPEARLLHQGSDSIQSDQRET